MRVVKCLNCYRLAFAASMQPCCLRLNNVQGTTKVGDRIDARSADHRLNKHIMLVFPQITLNFEIDLAMCRTLI